MAGKLVLRGALAGALAGLLAFVCARIFVEPQIQQAIDYETGRNAAQAALDKAAGLPVNGVDPQVFSRGVQATLGLGAGLVGFGVAIGLMFAVVYALCLGRVGNVRPRTLAVLVAGGGFLGVYLVPMLKYPANPPAIGHPDTIGTRSSLYLGTVLGSVILLAGAVWLGQRLARRFGGWNATLLAGAGFFAAAGVMFALLPSVGSLGSNVAEFGRHATETPLPLTDPSGKIVYPGFPADVLFDFRLYSVLAQVVLWASLGLAFGPLAERVLAPRSGPAAVSPAPDLAIT